MPRRSLGSVVVLLLQTSLGVVILGSTLEVAAKHCSTRNPLGLLVVSRK
ncbi:MAG: hypothetical protein QW123_00570 [Desulfurococcaceae archaeon]